jgi:hypothetical protein
MRMRAAVEETAEAAPAVGLEAPGPEAVVAPVAPEVLGVTVALPTTRHGSQHTSSQRSR